jgi:hypothetical protein
MKAVPPIELAQIGLDRDHFTKSDAKSWRGPCPRCGGKRRYVLFTDQPFPLWHGWCDACGKKDKYWQQNRRDDGQADPHWQERVAQEEQARAAYRRKRLAEFSTRELWEELHERMTAENYAWWRSQGIPQPFADFWRLGYTPERTFEHDGETFVRPAYTIPKFDLKWVPRNIDYRIVDPPEGVGKYRPAAGLSPAAFLSRPDMTVLPDEVIVVEGSKKAMVVSLFILDGEYPSQVIGVPSKNSWAGMADLLRENCGRVWIVLDPDARLWSLRMAQAIGPAARVVTLPSKPDDAFLHYGLTPEVWREYLRCAERVC